MVFALFELMSDIQLHWDWDAVLVMPPAHTPPRVLVAEDDDWMRQLVVEALQKDGYDVQEASDGRLLAALAHEFDNGAAPIDALVSDVRMPICSGMEVLEHLRAARCRIPIVLMTAFGDDWSRGQARRLGAVLIDKPFPLVQLRAVVARMLRPRPSPP